MGATYNVTSIPHSAAGRSKPAASSNGKSGTTSPATPAPATSPEFIRRLEEEIDKAVESRQQFISAADSEPVDIPDYASGAVDVDQIFTQKAFDTLYGDKPWISVDGVVHFWTGTYYKSSPNALERKRVAMFCNTLV